MARATLEVADIFRRFGEQFRVRHRLSVLHLRVMRALEVCRTALLGGHVERCTQCDHERISYNSCRNRHCPKCQQAERAEWVEKRKAELLPVEYYHVVFTTPQQLNALALQNKRVFYTLLFEASAQTLLTIAADPKHLGARIGFFSLLHTLGTESAGPSSCALCGDRRRTESRWQPLDLLPPGLFSQRTSALTSVPQTLSRRPGQSAG